MTTKRTVTILIALAAAVALTVSLAVAAKDPTVGGADGNNGLRTQGEAPGTKLIGPVFVAYPDYPMIDANGTKYAAMAEVYLRLRKAVDLQVFHAVIEGPLYPESDPEGVQNAIIEALSDEVLDHFFPNEPVEAVLKSADEFIADNFCLEFVGPVCVNTTLVTTTDLVIAVK